VIVRRRTGQSGYYLFKSQIGVNRPLSRSHVASILHEIYDRHRFTGKLGTHALRKSFAAKMWQRLGKDIVKVQAAMGHENINSTVKYLCNFANEEIQDAILAA
jgi:site-specific recombinase XerD